MLHTVTGSTATIVWGYHVVAALDAWRLERQSAETATLTATVRTVNLMQLTQHPLVFVARPEWRWPITTISVADRTLTATLGPLIQRRSA